MSRLPESAAVVLLLLSTGTSGLKLNPVKQMTHRIDLFSESKASSLALNNAILRRDFLRLQIQTKLSGDWTRDDAELDSLLAEEMLASEEINKLKSTIKRWSYIEEKLRFAASPGSNNQLQAFEDIEYNIASSKVLIAHLLLTKHKSNEHNRERNDSGESFSSTTELTEQNALYDLELSCPVLWKHASSWRSVDSGWMDCFSSMGAMYIQMGRTEYARSMNQKLLTELPWLWDVIPSQHRLKNDLPEGQDVTVTGASPPSPPTDNDTTHLALTQFLKLSKWDKMLISSEIKSFWGLAHGIRSSFRMLIEDFLGTPHARLRISIFIRAQQVTDEILSQFLNSTNSSLQEYITNQDTDGKDQAQATSPSPFSESSVSSESSLFDDERVKVLIDENATSIEMSASSTVLPLPALSLQHQAGLIDTRSLKVKESVGRNQAHEHTHMNTHT